MKKGMLLMASLLCLAVGTANAFSVRYYNKDSKDYEMDVKACGSSKEIDFGSSRTATASVSTSCSEIVIKTSCGEVTVKDGAKITIKDGCITVD